MNNVLNQKELDPCNKLYDEMKVKVIKKSVQLLSDDMLDDLLDPYNQKYFGERVTYFYRVIASGESDLLTTKFLRSLHSTFNNYYHSYHFPLPGTEISDANKERNFLYREVNDQLEDFLCDF